MAELEHVNITVADGPASAAWIRAVFGWSIRWQGTSMDGAGDTIHIGTNDSYIALYAPKRVADRPKRSTYVTPSGLNHVGVLVDDLDAVHERVVRAGFTPGDHHDYEPGRRFYFDDNDGIEWEVISYASPKAADST